MYSRSEIKRKNWSFLLYFAHLFLPLSEEYKNETQTDMNCIRNLCALAFMMIGLTASAQNDEKSITYPQLFFGAQAGTQVTFSNYNNWELFTPNASFSFGSFFTPIVGARLHVNGAWNKGGYIDSEEDFRYKYKYMTSDVDVLVNLVTLIGKKEWYPVNVYLIGGLGLNYAWDNGDAYAHNDKLTLAYENGRFSHNARLGAQADCSISKHVSINLELTANTLMDKFNSKKNNKGDWQLVGQLGLVYKFAAKRSKKAKGSISSDIDVNPSTLGTSTEKGYANTKVKLDKTEPEVWETRQDTIWYDDVVEASKPENGSMTWNVFYDIRESDFKADNQLAEIGAFLKDWKNCKVDVKSYADAGTGNSEINLKLSKERMEKAVKALIKAGVPASSITSNYVGDTIQPFAENDKNRVTIIIADGQKDGKDKRMVKKFRAKEVRYRVK